MSYWRLYLAMERPDSAPQAPWWVAPRDHRLHVEESDVERVAGDELTPGLDIFAHQQREHRLRRGCVVHGYLTQNACGRVHGRFPQRLGIHLAETLVAPNSAVLIDLLAGGQAGGEQTAPERCMATGMPRPASATSTPPSVSNRTSIAVPCPPIASSTALSTISQTRCETRVRRWSRCTCRGVCGRHPNRSVR